MTHSPDTFDPTAAAEVRIVAFYCFVRLADPAALRDELLAQCQAGGIKGTIILADEGYNGTVAGPAEAIAALVERLEVLAGDAQAEIKFADAPAMPFGWLRVRHKREIVTMGVPDLDIVGAGGAYVDPADWNALIADPATLLVDTRNRYEYGIGTFEGAIDPDTQGFTEFPTWLKDFADSLSEAERRERPLAMFCTGGIRCEKSTALARSLGFGNVHHLKGGILAYLEQVEEAESRWNGDCFVFDQRVAVTHGLAPGHHVLCKPCGMPVAEEDMAAHSAVCRKG
ncbi:rhodanese domain-containing protein [Sphingobium sufflavum]|uniref:oxygen-dependent tRNA uridine(34) hydroxylase TrhO n=1 Tax=Sphingobium sufflavum TaxID=1129547 RepID=UPI001F2409B9|nr:rhodanese domain-containing protein [Sphingobium sufflavum]MCE7795041.1 rhodanese domain-containing protein [Sphingobium sufflavum]